MRRGGQRPSWRGFRGGGGKVGPLFLAGTLRINATWLYFAGRIDEGRELGREAVAVARSLGDDHTLGIALFGLAICSHEGDAGRGMAMYAEAAACG